MRLLSKLRRRKCHEDLQALSASLPEVPFTDQASESTETGAPASEDSGYDSTESTSPSATTPTELSPSEEEDTPEKKFAQLADFDRDVLHRRRRATIRFELFGNDDAEDEDAEGGVQNIARPVQRPQLGISTSEIVPRPPAATTPLSADPPQPLPYRLPPARAGPAPLRIRLTLSPSYCPDSPSGPTVRATSNATPEPGRSFTPATVATTAERPHRVRLLDGGRQQAEDDDERPLATLRRSASVLSVIPRQQLDCELLSAQISMPFWLPPLASATHPHAIAWRPLSGAGMPAAPRSPRGAIVGLSRHEFTSTENSHKETAEPIPRVAPTCLVCSPVSARRVTDKPFPGSLHWPTPSLSAGAAPKSVSFPIPARSRQMPIAARKPDLRSRHSSVELHGSFKVIEHDFRLASKSKRWTAGGVSLRKARSFWHATPDSPSTCCA
ncbi:hypothetical protein JCM3774_002421 [Rhodotorula dairenensis]